VKNVTSKRGRDMNCHYRHWGLELVYLDLDLFSSSCGSGSGRKGLSLREKCDGVL
jgi:hypothetical protein